jgi:molybdopterin synthase sulfur carrier subunit
MAATVTVQIPTPLRGHVDGQAKVELQGATVREVLNALAERYPRLRGRLLDDRNEINRFVNVFLNEEDIRFLENLGTPVKQGDGIMIVPAIAGGCCGVEDDRRRPAVPRQRPRLSPSTTPDCAAVCQARPLEPAQPRSTRASQGPIEQWRLDTLGGLWWFQSVAAKRPLCCCCTKARGTSRRSNRFAFMIHPD